MDGHAHRCVELYLRIGGKSVDQRHKVSTPCLDVHQSKWKIWSQFETYQKHALRLYWNAYIMLVLVALIYLWTMNNLSRSVNHGAVSSTTGLQDLYVTSIIRQIMSFNVMLVTQRLCRKSFISQVHVRRCSVYLWHTRVCSGMMGEQKATSGIS